MVSGGVVQVWPCDHSEAVWTILYDGSTKYNKYTATPLVPMVTQSESIFCTKNITFRTQDSRAVRLLKLLEPDQNGSTYKFPADA